MSWVAVGAFVLSGCGSEPGSATPASGPLTSASSTTAATASRHFDHATLAAALPAATEIAWLPAGVTQEDDSDLTTDLTLTDCAGAAQRTPVDEAASTNRRYLEGMDDRLKVAYYDVATVDDATAYLDALAELIQCVTPPQPGMSFETLTFTDGGCDQTFGVLTHQPVSETIDVWCRVGNLIAAVHLTPTGLIGSPYDTSAPPPVPPTVEQAQRALTVVGQHLRAAFAGG